jgi:DNA gyrase subunit A
MKVKAVSEQGRATQGVKLIRIDEGDAIAAITNLDEEEVETETPETGTPAIETDGTISNENTENNEQPGGEAEPPAGE